MPGDALWEVFRKRLQELEREGDDLTALVKELREIRDGFRLFEREISQTQKDVKRWFEEVQRNSTEEMAKAVRSVENFTVSAKARLEEISGPVSQKVMAQAETIRQVSNRLTSMEDLLEAGMQTRFRELEHRLKACQELQQRMEKDVQELRSGFESAQRGIRMFEDFLDRIYVKVTTPPISE